MDKISDRALVWTGIILILFSLVVIKFVSISTDRVKEVERTLTTFNKHFHDHAHDFEGIVGKKKTGGVNYDEKSKVSYKPYER